MRSRRRALTVVLLTLTLALAVAACTQAPVQTQAQAQAQTPTPSKSREPVQEAGGGLVAASLRDLAADERMGGHTLSRHVGKTDPELAARLRREPNISAASTYTSAAIVSAAVGAALQQQRTRLDRWLARSGGRPNLVLNYVQTTGPPVGRSLTRGASASVPCFAALVVIRWDEGARRWFVLTSYPEVGR